ncbi:MAG: hypothetical protein OXI87_12395 [Albidovulum sp.]|nr:hypothetical protein [Albidovulum sp.]
MPSKDSSPRATGPAGGQFEAKVGTHYALALLARTEPFGLPGAIVDRIEFQRSGQGHPLDDVIVRGATLSGEQRCLEIQVKRSMSFTKNDANFASIVEGIVKARKTEPSRRFAAAIERTTGAIENGVQEALELAQRTVDASEFLRLLKTPGRTNIDMRRFVEVFGRLLAANGETGDGVLHIVLRSFSVLTFDYARPNSIAEHHDRLRARRLASGKCGTGFYDALFGIVLRTDAIGGEFNRTELIGKLNDLGITVGSAPQLAVARSRIEEISRCALSDISFTVNNCRLMREKPRRELEALLDSVDIKGGVIEISGPSGVGKSGLLRTAIEAREAMSRILVLAPDRTTPGGWPELRAAFRIEASADEFLSDLACDGGGYLCIDGLDRFRDSAQRKTVHDLLRSALSCPGVTVLITAQPGWEEEGARWIAENVFAELSVRRRMLVGGFDDDEAEALAMAAPQLAPLLRPGHPAKSLARNPLKLRLLVGTRLNKKEAISEAALARDWWSSGAQSGDQGQGAVHARKRVLNAVANGFIDRAGPVDVSGHDAQSVAELIAEEVLVEIHADQVRFRHDLFADWALALVLSDDPGILDKLSLDAPPPFWMSRGFEMACRMLAESDDDNAWKKLVVRVEAEGVSSGWAGLALLAIVRSECADVLLGKFDAFLLDEKGTRAARLIRRFIASHTQSALPLLREVLPEGVPLPDDMKIPRGPEWGHLIPWCLKNFDRLGAIALSAVVDLFGSWLALAPFGEKTLAPVLLGRLTDILVADIAKRDLPPLRLGEPLPDVKYAVASDALETARYYLAAFARFSPCAAARYLTAVKASKRPEEAMSQILEFIGKLPSAAPGEFAAAFLRALEEEEEEDDDVHSRSALYRSYAMSRIDGPFVRGRCGIGLFTEILEADSLTGVSFIRNLVDSACAPTGDDREFSVRLLGKARTIKASFSYGWSRGRAPSTMLTKALSALEHWAHRQIDGGEPLDSVVASIAGDGPISCALWLVLVDLVLSHSSLNGEILRSLMSSPETLALDAGRANHDKVYQMSSGHLRRTWLAGPKADQAVEEDLAGRVSRTMALHDIIPQAAFKSSEAELGKLHSLLEAAVGRLGPWADDAVIWGSPVFMASHAFRLASRDNYEFVTERDPDGIERRGWTYEWPAEQKKWLEEGLATATVENLAFIRSLGVRTTMDDETATVSVNVTDAEAILDETDAAAPGEDEATHDPNDPWLARVSAAAFLARFGSTEEVERRRSEITSIFAQALQPQKRPRFIPRDDVMYDAQAIAIAGRLYLAIASGNEADAEDLLKAVAEFPVSAAPAFLRHGKAVDELDAKLVISLGRIALVACMIPRRMGHDEDEAAYGKRRDDLKARIASRMEAERKWLNSGAEPDWPTPPSRQRRRPKSALTFGRRVVPELRDPREPVRPDYYYDEKTGTAWLRILARLDDVAGTTSEAVMRANRDWLLETNKPGEDWEDDDDIDCHWTRGLMDYAAAHARRWTEEVRRELVYDVLAAFSDEAFIGAAAVFVLQSDLLHIEGGGDDRAHLLSVRKTIWPRLKEARHWCGHLQSSRDGMEIHLKMLISAFYMRLSSGFGDGTPYTKGLSDPELTPFLPLLSEIAGEASRCPTIALLYLHILECLEPSTAEASLASSAEIWARDADIRFWKEFGIGSRVLAIGSKASTLTNKEKWQIVCESVMAAGVSVEDAFLRRLSEQTSQ